VRDGWRLEEAAVSLSLRPTAARQGVASAVSAVTYALQEYSFNREGI
jgi:hypothetical protein